MSPLLQKILNQVKQLSPEDQQALIREVSQSLENQSNVPTPKHKLSEFRGIAPNLLEGKDAQEWVNELREEWDEREQNLHAGL